MENERREAFKKYKELRVYFNIRKYTVIQYNNEGMEFDLPFDWFKFSSRGVTIKDKNSGKEIHFKYSSVNGSCSSALIIEDVELYTPFIKEDDKVKFITWKEWDEKYNTEAICKRITTVTDEHLKEHGTDLMYILDKMCACAGHANFDHPHRFIKVEPRYQDNEYSIHRVAADFKWHYGAKQYDCIRYLFEYEAKDRTIHIVITKNDTWYTAYNSFGLLSNNISMANQVDEYRIDVEFNNDYSISKVTVKNKNKENLLKFMEMGNPVIKNTIRQIRDYINAKLTENQLTSRINTSTDEDMFVQTWNFSSRVDVRPYTDSIRKANERAKSYNIFDFNLNSHGDLNEQIKQEIESIYHTLSDPKCGGILKGYMWIGFSGDEYPFDHAKYEFKIEHLITRHIISIKILDQDVEKIGVFLGFEGHELVSIELHPGFDKFEATINTIYNPRVKRLVSEIFNKLYKGEEYGCKSF